MVEVVGRWYASSLVGVSLDMYGMMMVEEGTSTVRPRSPPLVLMHGMGADQHCAEGQRAPAYRGRR